MTPYIVMAIMVIGMGFAAWLVLYWERKDRDERNKH